MSTNNYFHEVGAWPQHSGKLLRTYVIGFILSLALTFIAYFATVQNALPQQALLVALLVLACAQFGVQIVCFLHLGKGSAARDKDRLIALCSAILIVLILVSGSLWIMFSLNNRMAMTPAQMEQYMNDQEGI